MCVPTSLTVYQESLLGFVTTEHVFERTSHHVVNTRQTIGAWRTFKENPWLRILAGLQGLFENLLIFPTLQDRLMYSGEV